MLLAFDGFLLPEVHLGGLADQVLGIFDVLHAGELDDDPVGAAPLDDGLCNAETVDALRDDLSHAIDSRIRVLARRDFGSVGPQDEMRTALQVQAQHEIRAMKIHEIEMDALAAGQRQIPRQVAGRVLRPDDDDGSDEQDGDREEEEVQTAIEHRSPR